MLTYSVSFAVRAARIVTARFDRAAAARNGFAALQAAKA